MAERSPEERERARLEREARRAAREGRAAPQRHAPPQPQPAPPAPPPPASEAPPPAAPPEPAPPAPPATGREWRRAAGEPDPDPPLVRRVPERASASAHEEVHAHREPLPEPAATPPPAERRIPPPPPLDGGERAIGTRRVAASQRSGRPHLPHRGRRGPRSGDGAAPGATRTLGRVGALLALAAVALVLWFAASLFQPFAGDGAGSVVVEIPQGASVSQVGDLLAEQEVISSGFFFGLRARLEGKDSQLNSGRIELKRDMSYAAALDALTQPAKALPKLTKVSIPEGLSRREIADTVDDTIEGDYMRASRRSDRLDPQRYGAPEGAGLEGFLFPATYDLRPPPSAEKLVNQQLTAFRRNFATVDLRAAKRKNLTRYDVLTIASMVEREASLAKERPLIAAVIYNRLKDGMPLGIDATLRYELENWTDPLKVSELEADTPYNTRTNSGLPPTPIGNPGLDSIKAAAKPADVDHLFYVVKPCGNGAHNFSSTDAEFQEDVAAYNRKREELGGKSPVTCK